MTPTSRSKLSATAVALPGDSLRTPRTPWYPAVPLCTCSDAGQQRDPVLVGGVRDAVKLVLAPVRGPRKVDAETHLGTARHRENQEHRARDNEGTEYGTGQVSGRKQQLQNGR